MAYSARGDFMSVQEETVNKAPLLGFLVDDSGSQIRVQVADGTWIIDRSDIEKLSDWENPVAVDISGRAVQVIVRSGSTIGFLQSIKVTASDRPMTLPEGFSKVLGEERLRELSETWGAQNDLQTLATDAGNSPTVCDWSDPNGFGLIIKIDDCRD
jgi:hypothetical protein